MSQVEDFCLNVNEISDRGLGRWTRLGTLLPFSAAAVEVGGSIHGLANIILMIYGLSRDYVFGLSRDYIIMMICGLFVDDLWIIYGLSMDYTGLIIVDYLWMIYG